MESRVSLGRKTALIAGVTGLVGTRCLVRLLNHPAYCRVTAFTRRPLAIAHERLLVELVDFDHLGALKVVHEDVFCCLGTTIKKAGSQQAFSRVDHDYPLALAKIGKAAGAQRFLLVSALGADAQAAVFYSRVKGETERDIAAIGLPRFNALRPSILQGERQEHRPGEKAGLFIAGLIAPLLLGPLRKYRPIPADDVAAAMIYAANHEVPSGPVDSDEIVRLAQLENAAN
jgi:uncharacterized protein YbjT (DUF2867 family)